MKMTPGEIVDKYTIAKLCTEKLGEDREGVKGLRKGVRKLRIKYPHIPWEMLILLVYRVNGFIWDFEEPIHLGRLDEEPIMAGVLAVRVRKLNTVRVGLSHLIDTLAGEGRA